MRIFLFLLFLLPLSLQAQNSEITVSGRVVNASGEPLPGASVRFIGTLNDFQEFVGITKDDGCFLLSLPLGFYKIQISFIGFYSYNADIEVSNSVEIPDVVLLEDNKMLEELMVVGHHVTYNSEGYKLNIQKNPLLKRQDLDRILLFLPGMMKQEDELKLYGKAVGKVYVNNREIKLAGKDLLDYLQTYHGKNIKDVQVIVSAGVEEQATAGGFAILKITTTKVDDGGMLSLGIGGDYNKNSKDYGNPFGRVQIRGGKWSVFGDASLQGNKSKSESLEDVQFGEMNFKQNHSIIDRKRFPVMRYTLGVGYDFTPCDIVTLEGIFMKNRMDSKSSSCLLQPEDGTIEMSDSESENRTYHRELSVDYVHSWNSGEFSVAGSYLYNNTGHSGFRYRSGDVGLWNSRQNNSGNYVFYNGQVDFVQNLKKQNGKLKLGVAYMHIGNETMTDNQLVIDNEEQTFGTYIDNYNYDETNWACYGSYDFMWKAFSVSLGLRYEYSRISPKSSLSLKQNIVSRYRHFFPNIRFNYSINPMKGHNFSLSYVRNIKYPFMNMLNPGVIWNSEYSYSMGNPYLRPGCGKVYTGILTLFGNVSFSAVYTEEPEFSNYFGKEKDCDVYFSTYKNGQERKLWVLGLNVMKYVNSKWMFNVLVNRTFATSVYDSEKIKSKHWLITLSSTNNLFWNIDLQSDMTYVSPSEGMYVNMGRMLNISMRLSKSFLSNSLVASLGYIYQAPTKTSMSVDGVAQHYSPEISSHMAEFRLRYTLKWGNKQAKVRRGSNTGLEMKKRLN